MKQKNFIVLSLAFVCMLFVNEMNAQKFVENIDITDEKATIEFVDNPNMAYIMEIGGPGSYYWKKQILNEKELSLKALSESGKLMPNGQYTIQITPMFLMTPEERVTMREISQAGDEAALAAFRESKGIPLKVEFYNYSFHIQNGKFLNPDVQEEPMKTPGMAENKAEKHVGIYASLNEKLNYSQNFTGRAWDKTYKEMDQVILDDLIVDGSACIGQDCVNGESFGFDTVRLKENNLRIKAQDTSASASFPTNDWQITFNDSSNGGANKFSIDDIDGGRTPFTIEASAPSHSLYVDDGGRIGLGTSTPVVELHMPSGDTPTMRLEQDGTSGFTPQTWDVAGNETNFFIRDATNGSKLPFKIRPSAPTNSLFIDTDGDVGLGTASPSARLDVIGTTELNGTTEILATNLAAAADANQILAVDFNTTIPGVMFTQHNANNFGIAVNNSGGNNPNLSFYENGTFRGTMGYHVGGQYVGFNNAVFSASNFGFRLNADGSMSYHDSQSGDKLFEVTVGGILNNCGPINSSAFSCSSDRRFKENIHPLQNSLRKVMQMRGVTYDWNRADFPKRKFEEGTQFGFIAQEVEAIFPDLVRTNEDGYKAVEYNKVTPILVEALKEQQAIINAQQNEITVLQDQVAELANLKAQVAELAELVLKQTEEASEEASEVSEKK